MKKTAPTPRGKHGHLRIGLHSSRFGHKPLTNPVHIPLELWLMYQTPSPVVKVVLAGQTNPCRPQNGEKVGPSPLAEREGFEPPRRLRA